MMETATNTEPGTSQDISPMEGVEATAPAPALSDQISDHLEPAKPVATQEEPAAPAPPGTNDPPQANEDSSGHGDRPNETPLDTQAQEPEENQNSIPLAEKSEEPPLTVPAEATASVDPPPISQPPADENNSTVHDNANVENPPGAQQEFNFAPLGYAGGMDPDMVVPSNEYFGNMDVQAPDAFGMAPAIPPEVLDAARPGSLASAAQIEESRQCAFAKLEFPDGDFYMTTYAVELGRDARAHKQEMRRWRQRKELEGELEGASSVGDVPQTPVRPTAPSVVSACRSNLSECGGIMGRDDSHVVMGPTKKRRKKKESKSTSSSSQRQSRKNSLGSNILEPVDYNELAMLPPSRPDTSSFLPDPTEIPLVPIHPPITDDGPVGHKGISRRHLKIYYSFDNQVFEMKVLGRNGAFLNNTHYVPEDPPKELKDGDQIQIGAVSIMFRLPNAPADDDVRSEDSDNVSAGISLNFEDGRGESIVVDESSDDGFSYAEQYDFSPHAYGWASEEEEYSEEDQEDEYQEEEQRPVKLKLKLKVPPKEKPRDLKAERRAREKEKKRKKQEKLKAKQEAKEAKAAVKTIPRTEKTKTPSEEKAEEKEKEREKKREEKKEKLASKTVEKPDEKPETPENAEKLEKPAKPPKPKKLKEDREPVNQVTVIPPQDIPQPSTETPQDPSIKTEPSEKPPEPNINKEGRRVLTAEEAERLGLEPGTVIERKKGPGRPPKDGIMSKREKAEIMRRKKEAEKARKLGLDPESIAKVDLTKPKAAKDGDKSDKKPKGSEGAEGDSAPPEGSEGAEKKPIKISRPLRSPSPETKESDYTEEQLQRPAANYVVLIHEAISNSKEGKLNLQQIYSAIERKYPYYKFKTGTTGWQSSVRHNLGQHDAFRKAEKEGKGWMWAINPGVSIEKERRKRVTPPPQPQPRPYYPPPPHGQSPYGHMMPPHGVPNYQHPGPYGARPHMPGGAPGAPGVQQRTYQSPYGSQPLGQAANPQAPSRPGYPPNGARPPYGPYASSPYGQPPSAPPMSYPPASGASHPQPGSSYATAGPSPSPYAPTTSSASPYNPYPGRPTHTPQPPPNQTHPTQPPQQSTQSSTSTTTQPASNSAGQNNEPLPPLPPRTPNIYSDSAPYSQLLNSFRDYYIRNAWRMLKRVISQDQVVKLVDRGLERALHPERYINEREPRDENDKKDVKDEKDIESAVKGMLIKFGHSQMLEEAQKRAGMFSESPASAPAPVVAPAATGQAPQVAAQAAAAAAAAAAPAQPQGQAPAATSSNAPQPATGDAKASTSTTASAPGPASAASDPVSHALPPTTPAAAIQIQHDAKSAVAAPASAPAPAAAGSAAPAPAHAPSPINRASGTGTPAPPPIEALTPLNGSPRIGPTIAPAANGAPAPGQPTAPPSAAGAKPATPSVPITQAPVPTQGQDTPVSDVKPAVPAISSAAPAKAAAPEQAPLAQAGVKRPLESGADGNTDGQDGSEAKKAKVEA